jgi:hypothetical protein
MRELIREKLIDVDSLEEVGIKLKAILEEFTNRPGQQDSRIGYVAGIVNSDGPEFRDRNIDRLNLFTEKIGHKFQMPAFSAADVYSEDVFNRVTKGGFNPSDFVTFWRGIFELGYITDVFMTPRWEVSEGAQDEHETAQRLGIRIHYVNEDLLND